MTEKKKLAKVIRLKPAPKVYPPCDQMERLTELGTKMIAFTRDAIAAGFTFKAMKAKVSFNCANGSPHVGTLDLTKKGHPVLKTVK